MLSPFKDKFGVPRQPGLVTNAKGVIKFKNHPDIKTALKGLEEFSHLWIVFVFHEHGGKNWKPSIRPPRLGGAKKVGVLSSRSPHRPNPIGLSACAIEKVDLEAHGGPEITVLGIDLIDQTPVLDVKPYLVYADSIPEATAGWASAPIIKWPVVFNEAAKLKFEALDAIDRCTIKEFLSLDPRPAFQKTQMPVDDPNFWGTKFGFDLLGVEVKYELSKEGFLVTLVEKL